MDISISLAPETIFHIGSFPITNTLLGMFFITAFLIAVILGIRFSLKTIPGKAQSIMELMLEEGMKLTESIIGSKKKAQKVFPLVFTMFVFILMANLMTYIPGQAAVSLLKGDEQMSIFRAVMSDYGMVFVLTTISILVAQVVAIFAHGPFGYIGKFINLKGPLDFVLGIMDLIGEIAKVLSLSFRLFGNMFAGEVLGAVMLFLAPFFIPLPFAFLGLITAVIQAFVFSLLTLIFISMASQIESNEKLEEASI